MSIKSLDREQLAEMSMIEMAYEILKEEKTTFSYLDLLKRVAELKEMTEEEVKEKIGYLYTHLNVDGRFVCLGDNVWGLKAWYPMEKLEEDIITQKPKKKAKLVDEDDLDDELLDEEEFEDDEYDEIEDELDEIADEDDRDEFEEDDLDGFADEEPDEIDIEDDDLLDDE